LEPVVPNQAKRALPIWVQKPLVALWRAPGAERLIVARSSELFKFESDGKRHSWPDKTITREALLAIAQQDPAKFSVWQEFQKKPDEEILAGHPADLEPEGVERFYTVMKHTTEGLL
jgi:hypothetical protein